MSLRVLKKRLQLKSKEYDVFMKELEDLREKNYLAYLRFLQDFNVVSTYTSKEILRRGEWRRDYQKTL